MSYVLGPKSEKNLIGVKAPMVILVRRAIQITDQDFQVHDGVRTPEEQAQNIANGVSWTNKSDHLIGEAVDLVPWINGKLSWDWQGCYKIAVAMQKASVMMDIPIIWGGVWDRILNDIGNPEDECRKYVQRRRALGKKANIDGPHFELTKR